MCWLEKKRLYLQRDTVSKCRSFNLSCIVQYTLYDFLFCHSSTPPSAVFLQSPQALSGEHMEGAAGKVMFGLEKTMYFQNKFPSQILRLLNNYFLWDGFFHPLPVAFLLEFIFCERGRDFSGLRILPRKLFHLQLGLKRLFWFFQSLFLGVICLHHGDGAHCATAMSPLPTSVGKPLSFWDPSSLTFEAWISGECRSMRLIPVSRQLSALTLFAVVTISQVHCGSERRKFAHSHATTTSTAPWRPKHKFFSFGTKRERI